MSETLSTLIAFVGFLVLLSMLVQSLQEGLKNLLKLKTGVYERFFINLYEEEFFKPVQGNAETTNPVQVNQAKASEKTAKEEQGKSGFFRKIFPSRQFVGEFDKRIGRLKNVVDQADKMFRETKYALHRIADLDPSAPDYTQKMAAAAHPVVNSLGRVAALRLDLLLEIFDKFTEHTISNLQKAVLDSIDKYALPLERKAKKDLKHLQEHAKQLLNDLETVDRKISGYRVQIEQRMDAWLAQLNEVYKRNMLWWTVAIGAAIVFMFNADAFSIYRYLATHDVARAVISQQVEGKVVPVQKAKPEDLNKIYELIEQENAREARERIVTFSANLADDFKAYKEEGEAERARNIMNEAKTIKVGSPPDQAVESLKAKTGELAMLYVSFQKSSFDRQLGTLTSLGLPLGWGEDWKRLKQICKTESNNVEKAGGGTPAAETFGFFGFLLRKIGGLILTIFLITFGAPFWNDILSALTGFKNKAVKEGKPGL